MVGGGDQRQFIVQPGDDFQFRVLAWPFHQAKIHGAGQHGGDDVAGVGHVQAQPAIRLLAAQRRQALRQQVIGDGGAGPQLQRQRPTRSNKLTPTALRSDGTTVTYNVGTGQVALDIDAYFTPPRPGEQVDLNTLPLFWKCANRC